MIHSRDLVEKLKENGANAIYADYGLDGAAAQLKSHLMPGDIFITMGAGNIFTVGEQLIK